MLQTRVAVPSRSLSPLVAWRNVLGATVVGWLIIALPNFGFLTNYLAKTMKSNLLLASFFLSLGFFASVLVVIGLLIWWQYAHGETLADIGWRRPTTIPAIIAGVLFGALWVTSSYTYLVPLSHIHANILSITWERLLMIPIGVVLAFGEELLFRGFVMTQLQRASVPTWLQIVVSGVCIGSYHGLLGFNYSVSQAIASAVIFSIVAAIYVLGKRSLTPGLIGHAMTHVLGDPFLTMAIIAAALHFGVR